MGRMVRLLVLASVMSLVLAWSACDAAVPIALAPNTTFTIGPLPALCCWADAYFNSPGDYGDWTVGGGGSIDGNVAFIWLRQSGQWAQTTLACATTDVVVGFGSDMNDGICEIFIDNVWAATIDTYSNPGVYWYTTTSNLPLQQHTIWVIDNGETSQLPPGNGNDDISIDGAGTTNPPSPTTPTTWGGIKALF
jgi:hypothetical protein